MKIDKSRRIMFFVSLIGITIVTLIMGTTFAYQTIIVEYKEGSDSDFIGKNINLDVSYLNESNRINIENIPLLPDYKTAEYTEFTINTNKTSSDIAYQINLSKLDYSSALASEYFKYTITMIEEDKEVIIGEGDFSSLSGTSINLPFNMNSYRILEKENSETLRLYLWMEERDEIQNIETGSFQGNIEVLSILSNEAPQAIYKKFKIYGNSKQDGTPSVDNPIKIDNLGDNNLLNLLEISTNASNAPIESKDGIITVKDNISTNVTVYFDVEDITLTPGTYTLSLNNDITNPTFYLLSEENEESYILINGTNISTSTNITFTVTTNVTVKGAMFYGSSGPQEIKPMLSKSNTALPYVPYGKYKIPIVISDNNQINPDILVDIYLDEPLRKVNNDADYIDFINRKIVRNVKVIDNTNTLTIGESYAKLEVPKYEDLPLYYIPCIEDSTISVCSYNGVCADAEIETNK